MTPGKQPDTHSRSRDPADSRWALLLHGGAGAIPRGARGKLGRGAAKRPSLGGRSALRRGPSVDWDAVLKRLPTTFTSADLEKSTPKLKARPRARIMALARWSKAGAIKKVESGKYRKA